MEKKPKKSFKLVLYEEFSLDELINISMTYRKLLTYVLGIFFLIGFLFSLLFIFTPLSSLLPPVENYKLKNQIIENSILIDSLKQEITIREAYFKNIQNVINEQNISDYSEIDSSQVKNLLTAKQKDSLFAVMKEKEKEFLTKNYTSNIETKIKFEPPVRGLITNQFDIANNHLGIDIVAAEGTPVLSIDDGTVILATWSETMGYIIGVQHSNNFVSFYKHNSKLLKVEGDKVKSQDAIALVGNTGTKSTGPHLHFELWMEGQPVNPSNYISF